MLKNWTVITESIKSVLAREKYLSDAKHKNHRNTEAILNIFGSEETSLNMMKNCNKYTLYQASRRRGGRPPTPAIEMVFALPKGIRPSSREWRRILNIIMRNLTSSLDVTGQGLAQITRAVVHQQEQSEDVRGSGDHLHLLMGKFTNDLVYLRDLQRKSTTRLVKKAFNTAILEVMNIDHQSYKPQKNYRGQAKRRAPQWVVKAARRNQEIDNKENETTQRLIKLMSQATKWLEAFKSEDFRQMNRQYNRMKKELNVVDTLDASGEDKELSIMLKKLLDQVDNKRSGNGESELKKSLRRLF
ncbi:hypothetical protein A163_06560 [Vibrio tasmaniensis 1F-267]|uniref:Replication protein n=4 Tax=Vibrio TaxID=662 RepID=A0ABX3B5M6_9VIBR|nr:hypothetical protein A163_06560 [Vibrio tasmaniensis 1F-267]